MALEGFRKDENLGGKTERKQRKEAGMKKERKERNKKEERKNPVAGNWVLGLLT